MLLRCLDHSSDNIAIFFAVLGIETVGVELPSNGAWFLILFYSVAENFGYELFNHPE